jgi:hypothetical protein
MLHFDGGITPPIDTRQRNTMRWFRLHSRLGSGLAIFSLALQLALSFGHIHLKDIVGTAHASTSIAASTAASRSDDQPADATPTDRASHDHEDEYCAVYAINNLLGSAQVTQPPPLPLPCVFRFVGLSAGYEADLAELHHGLSRARAPPVV